LPATTKQNVGKSSPAAMRFTVEKNHQMLETEDSTKQNACLKNFTTEDDMLIDERQ